MCASSSRGELKQSRRGEVTSPLLRHTILLFAAFAGHFHLIALDQAAITGSGSRTL
jgi:hypothetical protein